MIITVGGIKGGTGKTTIAINLAVMRAKSKNVLLVDADEQKSTSMWASQRDVLGIQTNWSTIQLGGSTMNLQINRMKGNFDDIIIDVGGRATTSLRAAISISDIFLLPFKPRSLDVWTLGEIKTVISEMKPANPKLKAYAIINQADPIGSDNQDTLQILKECDEITCLDAIIKSRKAFANAASDGLSVIEMKNPDRKAIKEIQDVYDYLYNMCT